jgi:hypothetical protein
VHAPATGPARRVRRRGHARGRDVGGEGDQVVDVHPREALVRHGVPRRLVVADRRGPQAFQIELSPLPRIAGGRSSTRVSPSTAARARSASRLVTG